MKKILLFLTLSIPAGLVQAQCPTGNLTLASQADVDAFVSTYPDCSVLPGDLTITSATPPITDLTPLSQITAVTGKLSITAIFNDISLAGLENIQSARSLIIGSEGVNEMPAIWYGDLQPLENLSGHLDSLFLGNTFMESFGTAFPNITSVGYLRINNNPELTAIPLFPALDEVKDLTVSTNTALENIEIPANITVIDFGPGQDTIYPFASGIYIQQNPSLQTINSEAPFTSLHDLVISMNDALHTINGFSGLESIQNNLTLSVKQPTAFDAFQNVTFVENADIELNTEDVTEPQGAMNLTLGENAGNLTIGTFSLGTGFATSFSFPAQLTAVTGNMSVFTEATSFEPFAQISSVGGDLSLFIPGLTQIPAMPELVSIGGDLNFQNFSQAGSLLDFEGLNALETVGGNFRIGRLGPPPTPLALTSLNGLESLTNVGGIFSVRNLANLEDISAIQNLTTAAGQFHLDNLPLISEDGVALPNLGTVGDLIIEEMPFTTIPEFPGLTSLSGNLNVLNNLLLTSTVGLATIESIGGNITVQGNPLLNQLIFNPDLAFSGNLMLSDNPALDGCDENIVCTLVDLAETSEIAGNGDTCENLEEVLAACLVSTTDAAEAGLHIYQNANDQIVFQVAKNLGQANLSLYDMQGRILYQTFRNLTEGTYYIPILSGLSSGIYIINVEGNADRTAIKIPLNFH